MLFFEVAELLLSRSADVNARGCLGWTPLMYAARSREDLPYGCRYTMSVHNVVTQCRYRYAAREGHCDVALLLLQAPYHHVTPPTAYATAA